LCTCFITSFVSVVLWLYVPQMAHVLKTWTPAGGSNYWEWLDHEDSDFISWLDHEDSDFISRLVHQRIPNLVALLGGGAWVEEVGHWRHALESYLASGHFFSLNLNLFLPSYSPPLPYFSIIYSLPFSAMSWPPQDHIDETKWPWTHDLFHGLKSLKL
jgi:hypothetical protein